MWLKEFGYEENIDSYVDKMIMENTIECLPDDVKSKFEIKDCYVQVPLSEDKVNELKKDITDTIHEFRQKEKEYKETKDEMLFWQDVTDADAFRLATLSGYSRALHKPYDDYLKEQDMFKNNTKDDSDSVENNTEEDDLLSFLDSL